MLGGDCPAEPGLEVWSGPLELSRLPLRDRSVDAVTCIEGGVTHDPGARHALIVEAKRVLRDGGILALGVEPDPDHLWEVEDDLRGVFAHVGALAQLEWQGVSVAPLLPTAPSEALVPILREGLLDEPLPIQRYLLIASQAELESKLRECIIVPTGPVAPLTPTIEVVEVTVASPMPLPPEPEPEPEPEPAENTDFDLVALFAAESASALLGAPQPRVHEISAPAPEPEPEEEPEPEPPATPEPPPSPEHVLGDPEAIAELERLREIVNNFSTEREGLLAHVVKLASELDRSREEKARTDAELHAARQRLESLQHVQEDSRMHSLAMLMRRPDADNVVLTHELVDEVAPLAAPEGARATADAAIDRNRLREELARRTGELQELETRVLQQEEEIRREHLENVRLVTDVDRLREQVERSRAIEQDRVQELERLGHELRKLEMDHAELQGLYNTQEQRLRTREESGTPGSVAAPIDDPARRLELEKVTAQRDQLRARERAAADIVRRRDRELAEATRTVRELRRSVEDHATLAAQLRGELAVLQVHIQRLEETVPSLQERLREQQRKTIEREDESAELQRRLEEGVAEQEHLRARLRRQRQDMEALAGAKQGAEVELFRLRRELEAKHQAIDQLQQIVSLGASRMGQGSGPLSDAARAEILDLRGELADQAAEHAEALARSEAEHQRIVEHERARLRRSRLEAGIRAEEMEYMLFQLDTAEQKIWEMNDATDRSAARLAAGLAQLEKQKEQYEDLADELDVTRNLLVEAQAKIAELERLLDSERARLARVSLAPATIIDGPDTSGSFDVNVDEPEPDPEDSIVAPTIRRYPGDPDPLAGIDLDDESEPVSLAARLAGGTAADSGDFDMGSLGSAEVSSPVFRLPSDADVDLDDDVDPPTRVVVVPDEEEDEVFSIDTEWGELDDDKRPSASRASYERDLSNQRIVIEVLEDEAWPSDGEMEPELQALLSVRPDQAAEDGKTAVTPVAEPGKAQGDKSS
ncbi:methyltransferase domain-containing protein [Nannocystis punicea]|uniref:Methyltransferase domain-containing protein n=1 Tax=Nannocystis punicea TaxID=2995304 RepID=A0ABY7H614_9BACT|nr:methyltransferase domain-containing protein [Nannocystis poenicansa]WAS94709.1 methyltransferase domain-containing protein [Nannocystis poenicansa]